MDFVVFGVCVYVEAEVGSRRSVASCPHLDTRSDGSGSFGSEQRVNYSQFCLYTSYRLLRVESIWAKPSLGEGSPLAILQKCPRGSAWARRRV